MLDEVPGTYVEAYRINERGFRNESVLKFDLSKQSIKGGNEVV